MSQTVARKIVLSMVSPKILKTCSIIAFIYKLVIVIACGVGLVLIKEYFKYYTLTIFLMGIMLLTILQGSICMLRDIINTLPNEFEMMILRHIGKISQFFKMIFSMLCIIGILGDEIDIILQPKVYWIGISVALSTMATSLLPSLVYFFIYFILLKLRPGFKTVQFKEGTEFNNQSCGICLTEYMIDDTIVILPCNHEFHDDCVKDWIEKEESCPMCRENTLKLWTLKFFSGVK
ncbi:Zinc finger C3HC4 type protein [Spraguea lophii 42_110]|uniref:Zinc finger C3HC4 type protein n=1 Tax=Spraguea lophii (strain 42_110) TaxID=1358809 RepID=S7W8R3_SPRLO|nr:Zinc finger C3HC4 type protein [Spraguea lophii 42_110]